jgi:hypothetical protein
VAADVTIGVSAVEPVPLDYPIPGAAELLLKVLTASYNGAAAAGSYVPAIQLIVGGTQIVASFPLGQTLAAGASADVSWFPSGGVSQGSDVEPGVWNYATPVAPATAPAGSVAGVAFQNGWGNVKLLDGTYSPLMYRQEPSTAAVRIIGAIAGGSFGAPALQLPASLVPIADVIQVVAGINTTSALTCSLNTTGLLVPVGPFASGLTSLFTQTLGASATSIDTGANGIAAGHGDLLIFLYVRTDRAAPLDNIGIAINGVTSATYDTMDFLAQNTALSGAMNNLNTRLGAGVTVASATTAASVFSLVEIVIPAYDTTAGFKVARISVAAPTETTNGLVQLEGGQLRSTAAVNQITITSTTGSNLVAGTRLAIYGTQ